MSQVRYSVESSPCYLISRNETGWRFKSIKIDGSSRRSRGPHGDQLNARVIDHGKAVVLLFFQTKTVWPFSAELGELEKLLSVFLASIMLAINKASAVSSSRGYIFHLAKNHYLLAGLLWHKIIAYYRLIADLFVGKKILQLELDYVHRTIPSSVAVLYFSFSFSPSPLLSLFLSLLFESSSKLLLIRRYYFTFLFILFILFILIDRSCSDWISRCAV